MSDTSKWLPKLLGPVVIQADGEDLPARSKINFTGGATDDPDNDAINVSAGGADVADDIAKQGGSDINRVKGLNRVPFADDAGVEPADGAAPPVGGTWVYNELASTPGLRAKKPVMPGHWDLDDFGGVADWNGSTGTDNLAAWNALLAVAETLSPTDRGIKVVASGHYYFSDTVHIRRHIHLEGTAQSDENKKPGTMFVFPANTTGIRIHSSLAGDDPTSTSLFSIVRNLTVQCSDKQTTGHGVHTSTVCTLENVLAVNFAQNGIEIDADTSETTGNASTTRLLGVRSGANGGHGVHIRGGDANICTIVGGEAVVNGGWGVLDESGLGNTYLGFHCEGNLGAGQTGTISSGTPTLTLTSPLSPVPVLLAVGNVISIAGVSGTFTVTNVSGVTVTLDGNADADVADAAISYEDAQNHDFATPVGTTSASLFLGCYSEAAINSVNHPSQILGGILAEQPNIGDGHVNNGGRISGKPLTYHNTKGAVPIDTQVGDNNPDMIAFAITADNGDYYAMQYSNITKRWAWICNASAEFRTLEFPTPTGNPRVRAVVLKNGNMLGTHRAAPSDGEIYCTAGPNAPDATWLPSTWEVGDRVYDRAPTAGSAEGWICTALGTAGVLNGNATTADTVSASADITVSDTTDLIIGAYITIAGVSGVKQVLSRIGPTVTLDSTCDATVTGGAVAFSAPTFFPFGDVVAPAQAVSAFDIDWATGDVFTKTLAGGANTFTFSNEASGRTIIVRVTGAASTLTWPSVKWAGGTPPTQTASGTDVYTFVHDGTDIYGSVVQDLS